MKAYCVINEEVIHFIGTYKECLDFIARSTAAQELIDSTTFQIGDKVKPSSVCRPLYGDPDVLTVVDIDAGMYLTDIYPTIWLNEIELTAVQKKETYTREEVYLVAQRSVHAVINNLLTDNRTRTVDEVINSEIDTVKLF